MIYPFFSCVCILIWNEIYIYDIVQTSELYFNFQFSSLPNSYLVSGNAVLEFVLFAILLLVHTCT